MMRNLHRRIEALEKASSGKRDVLQLIAEKALPLWSDEVESLIAAYGADRVGRPHTEREAAARRAYTEAVVRECRRAGLPPAAASGFMPDLGKAFIHVLAFRLSDEELDLCISGVRAPQEGRAPTEQESAAFRTHASELERLCLLAGFDSVAEFEAFSGRADDRY